MGGELLNWIFILAAKTEITKKQRLRSNSDQETRLPRSRDDIRYRRRSPTFYFSKIMLNEKHILKLTDVLQFDSKYTSTRSLSLELVAKAGEKQNGKFKNLILIFYAEIIDLYTPGKFATRKKQRSFLLSNNDFLLGGIQSKRFDGRR